MEHKKMWNTSRKCICNCIIVYCSLVCLTLCIVPSESLTINHIVKRCWSDVDDPIDNLTLHGNSACFSKNEREAICFEVKSKETVECEPPWELASVSEPITLDYLAWMLHNGTALHLNYFPAVISGLPSQSSEFMDFFLKKSDCSTVQHVNNADIRNDFCALILMKQENNYYEAQFINDSCDTLAIGRHPYACAKTIQKGESTIVHFTTERYVSTTDTTTEVTSTVSIGSPLLLGLDVKNILIIAGAANVLLIVLIILICWCCVRKKSKQKSFLLRGSSNNSNRPLPTPEGRYKPNQSESEYFYPTLQEFQNRELNQMLTSEDGSTIGQCDSIMNDNVEYMGLGETVSESQRSLMMKRQNQKRQDRLVHSYLELDKDIVSEYTKPKRPLTHTYADLNLETKSKLNAACEQQLSQNFEGTGNCYMGINGNRNSHMYSDVFEYQGIADNIVHSGCTKPECQECQLSRGKYVKTQTIKPETLVPVTKCAQFNDAIDSTFYMAVDGHSRASCEIGNMAKCFEDNTYSFLK